MPQPLRPAALVSAVVASLVLLATPIAAAPKGPQLKPADVVLPNGFVPLTDADKSLAAVPFAPGAPAVVLLDAEQHDSEGDLVRVARRLKILTDAGSRWGTYTRTYYGDVRPDDIHARTVLPDGTIVDAAGGVHVETSKDPDMTTITVAFPRVGPGAILDLAYWLHTEYTAVGEWIPQEAIPVVESRLLLTPNVGMRYRTALSRLKPEEVVADSMQYGNTTLYAWIFRNVAPLPDVPNMPPRRDVSKKLVLIAESYDYGGVAMPLAADWKSYCREMSRTWDGWMKHKSAETEKLGLASVAGAATPRDKAEAVRKAVRARMSRAYLTDFPSEDTPDAALAQGRVGSADMAGVAAVMLRASGVPAILAAYRPRSRGVLPTEFPAPSMLDEALVIVPGAGDAGADLLLVPTSELPVGQLPPDVSGISIVPFTKDSEGPRWIPDVPAAKNALDRAVFLTLGLDGTVQGEAQITATGPAAWEWRSELAGMSADERKESLQDELRAYVPTAELSSWQVDGLDDETKDLVVALKWEAVGQAQRAGGRMLLNPFVFERFDASDWGAEARELDVWLGRPFQHRDTVTIRMPQGIASVQLPPPSKLEANDVGGYVTAYSGKDLTLNASRTSRFEQTRFPASSWAPLKAWFLDMAAADDQAIVFTLAEQTGN